MIVPLKGSTTVGFYPVEAANTAGLRENKSQKCGNILQYTRNKSVLVEFRGRRAEGVAGYVKAEQQEKTRQQSAPGETSLSLAVFLLEGFFLSSTKFPLWTVRQQQPSTFLSFTPA